MAIMRTKLLFPVLGMMVILTTGCGWTAVNTSDSASDQNLNETVVRETNDAVVDEAATNEAEKSTEVVVETEDTEEVDTSDWLTYEYDEYGFKFQYPNTWSFEDTDGEKTNEVSLQFISETEQGVDTDGNLLAKLRIVEHSIDPESIKCENQTSSDEGNFECIDLLKGDYFVSQSELYSDAYNSGPFYSYKLANNNIAIFITTYSGYIGDDSEAITQAIFDSIEIESTSASLDTSDWLTYENEEYGFSFHYPEHWVLDESDRNSCVGLMSKERYTERTQVLDHLKKDGGGTDAVPGNYINICLREENVITDIITWGERNVKKYVDETYRGESELNTIVAYLVVDLDFGESKNYYLKSENNNVYSVYHTVEKNEADDDIIAIVKSIKL